MSEMKKLKFEATIAAPPATVWEAMLGPETYPVWTEAFFEGSRFEGSWEQGSRMLFLDPSGNGMVSEIAENRLHEFLSIRHLGTIKDGVEDTESDEVKAWAPAYESYTFETASEGTRLVIDQAVDEKYEQVMADTWSDALARLKKICEGGAS